MERVKHSKYDQCCNESNTTLVPFVLSTFGHFGEEAERVFHGVTGALRRRVMMDDDDCGERRKCRQQLLIGLNREIARQLLQGPIDHGVPTAAAASADDIDADLEAQDEQELLTAFLAPDANNSRLPVDAEIANADAALQRAVPASARPGAVAQPPAGPEQPDVFMQDAAQGAGDRSMCEGTLVVE